MNLLKRIKNLWELSQVEVKDNELTVGEVTIPIKKPQKAVVIKKTNPVEDFLNENN